MRARTETRVSILLHRAAEHAGFSRPRGHFAEVSQQERGLLAQGSQKAINTEAEGLDALVAGGQERSTSGMHDVIATIARANVMREQGLHRTWAGYLAVDRAVMHFTGKPNMGRIFVEEFGPGNFTHDAAMHEEGLQQYQAAHVVGYEKGVQMGISQAAIGVHEQSGALPAGGYSVQLSEGGHLPHIDGQAYGFTGSLFTSGLAVQYHPELNMQLARSHAERVTGVPSFVGNWDLLHGYFGATAKEVRKGKIAIRPTHPGKGEVVGSSILEAALLGPAVEEQDVVIGDPSHPEKGLVHEHHQTYRHRLQFQVGVNARGSSIIPDYSTRPEGELTVITSATEPHAEPKVRLWATHYREDTPAEIKQLSRIIEYTVTQMYERAHEAGYPLDAAGILRQPELAPHTARHPIRRAGKSLTAVSLLQSESSTFDRRVEGYPDITMLGNILMLNRDVLEAMENRHLLTFVGESDTGGNKYFRNTSELIDQFIAHREAIRHYGIMTVPNSVAAVSALNESAAQLMQAAKPS